MRVFVTGATGFVGSMIVKDLIAAGHQVVGLTRSDAGAKSLRDAGAEPHHGDIYNLDTIRSGAATVDGVIHCAFNHDFSTFAANCEQDRKVIEALGSVLEGSNRPLVITSGTAMAGAAGRLATEDDPSVPSSVIPRGATEEAADAIGNRGVVVSVIRLPQVHDRARQGLVSWVIDIARQKGYSAFIGEGQNRWAAVHRNDVAPLYRLALEKGTNHARYNAVAEEGVKMRDIAEAIARGLKVPAVSITPDQAPEYFGWMAHFATLDMPASSALTQQRLGWHPTAQSTMVEDLNNATCY
jgi:nucleoside-diphosphate-sugar epimerase